MHSLQELVGNKHSSLFWRNVSDEGKSIEITLFGACILIDSVACKASVLVTITCFHFSLIFSCKVGNGLGKISGERRPCWVWAYMSRLHYKGILLAWHINVRIGRKWLTVTNTLAYFTTKFITAVKSLMRKAHGQKVIKLFTTVICGSS